MARFQDKYLASEHECAGYALPDGAVIGDEGAIYHFPSRAAVSETMGQWWISGRRSPELATPRFPRAKFLSGTALCLRTKGGSAFYHFLIEGMSRLSVLRHWLPICDWILITGASAPWKIEWLELAGVPLEKVLWTSGLTHIVFDQVVFATPFMREQQPTQTHVTRFRELFGPHLSQEGKSRARSSIIYVSRRDAGHRQWSNEDRFLQMNPDVQPLTLSDMPAREQLRCFGEANTIIGMHGSGLASIAFANAPFWVIELFNNNRYVPMYGRLTEAAGGKRVAVSLNGNSDEDLLLVHKALSLQMESGLE